MFIQKIKGSKYNNKKLILLNETKESLCQGSEYIFQTPDGQRYSENKVWFMYDKSYIPSFFTRIKLFIREMNQ